MPTTSRSKVFAVFLVTGRCYIGETGKPLEVRIREHKYKLTQGLLKTPHYSSMHKRKGTEYVGIKGRSYGLNLTLPTGNTRSQPTCFCQLIRSVNLSFEITPIWTPVIEEEIKEITTPSISGLCGNVPCFMSIL